jgi:ribosomal protein S28E/S33
VVGTGGRRTGGFEVEVVGCVGASGVTGTATGVRVRTTRPLRRSSSRRVSFGGLGA